MGTIRRTDVLIIGGGITARRAAKIIAEKYDVTLVCDGLGASPFIHGLNVPLYGSDSDEVFLADTLESGKHQNDPELVSILVKGAAKVRDEFSSLFDKNGDGSYDLLKPLGSSVPRVASIDNGKTGAKALRELSESAEYAVLTSTRALSLIKSSDAVVGAMLYDKKSSVHFPVYARAVLIATGGFGGIFRFSTNSPDIGGDGLAMALDAGAELVDMEFIQYEPTVAISPKPLVGKSIITTMLYEGAVIRNAGGKRFMDEKVGKDALSLGIAKEILSGGGTDEGGVFYDMTSVPQEMLTGKYKDYYQRYKNQGIDISKTPVEIAPAPHTTMGGIKIDGECKTAVRGLFAAGEAVGGVHGANRLGGNAGLEVFVFGDNAGKAIVRFLDENLDTGTVLPENITPYHTDVPYDVSEERESLWVTLDESLGVIRCEERMTEALGKINRIIERASSTNFSFSLSRLKNDATVAKAALTAALLRKQSVGSHVRIDESLTEQEKYRIILKNENGNLSAKRENLKWLK